MGRKRKVKEYLILLADSICGVSEDRVYDPESDPAKGLFDELQCPVADEVLIALRKSFSLTFPCNPFLDGVRVALMDIRRICVDAVKPLQDALKDLQLPPVPLYIDDPVMNKTRVFQFLFARSEDIDITVTVQGKRRKLLDEAEHQNAVPLLTTIRAVISDTFEEAHDEDQHSAILHRIRQRIWEVLPEFNVCLEAIDVEPIAGWVVKSMDIHGG